MVDVTVNGHPVSVADDGTVLNAVRAAGVPLPTLCHWDGLPPYGACRLCLVTITAPRHAVVASCAYPVEEGLVVETNAPDAVALRRMALEFLLSRCPTSDVVQSLAAREGLTGSRFGPPPPERSRELCVLCGLCVRVCRDLVGAAAIGFIGRGAGRQVGAPFRVQAEACIGCGACAAVCPTGAVRMEDRDGKRILHTWNTVIPLKPCASCGTPYAPEPMAFLTGLVEMGEGAWGVCSACRRKAVREGLDLIRA
jgi:bidirectional [NiFe] hydrogenase diaphorase subunit